MSVYKRGDGANDKDDKKKEKKKDIGDEIAEGFEKGLKNFTKGIDNLFGGKEKKWEKKGGGHTLGTAADAEAARQARLAALEQQSGASTSAVQSSWRAH